MKTTVSLLAVVMLSIASQAFARGSYNPPQPSQTPGDCWSADFTIAYRSNPFSQYEYCNGSASFDCSQLTGRGIEYLDLNCGLRDLKFDFQGKSFCQNDDSTTKLQFCDGELSGIKFDFRKDGCDYRIDNCDFNIKYGRNWFKKGFITCGKPCPPTPPCQTVPTPAAAASGLALLAAMAFRRRRQVA